MANRHRISKTGPPRLPVIRPKTDFEWHKNLDTLQTNLGSAITLQDELGEKRAVRVNVGQNRIERFDGKTKAWVPIGAAAVAPALNRVRILGTSGGGGGGATNDHENLIDLLGGYPIPGEHYHFTQYHHQELGRFGQWPGFTDQFMQAGYLQQLTVEKAATADDRTLVFLKNTSTANTNYAALVVENEVAGHAGVLAQFGSGYAAVPSFADKTALYTAYNPSTGVGSAGLVLLANKGMIEHWLYAGAYPANQYQHVADVRSAGSQVGFMPASDSTFYLGYEGTGVGDELRWKDASFDQIHLNGYAVTCEGASVLGQDYSIDATPTFGGIAITGAGNDVYAIITSGLRPHLRLYNTNANSASRNWDIVGQNTNYGTLDFLVSTAAGGAPATNIISISPTVFTLSATFARGANAITGTGDLGAAAGYVGTAYITRHYLNSTAYLDGGTAGQILNVASILKTYYAGGDARFIISPDGAQGRRSLLSLYANFTTTADNVARRAADIVGGYVGAWTGEYIGFEVGGSDNSFIETTERMRLTTTSLWTASGVALGVGAVPIAGAVISAGSTASSGLATPLSLSMGATYCSSAGQAGKSKIKLYDDGGTTTVYGFGISNALFEFHSGAAYKFYSAGTERFAIAAGGTITDLQTYSDTVGATNRDLYVDSTGKFGYVSSSRRHKTNIRPLEGASWLYDLRPALFDWKDGSYPDDVGLIAEEVAAVNPQVVSYNADGSPETVSYSKLIVPMLAELQALRTRVRSMEERLQ